MGNGKIVCWSSRLKGQLSFLLLLKSLRSATDRQQKDKQSDYCNTLAHARRGSITEGKSLAEKQEIRKCLSISTRVVNSILN